MSTDHTEGLEGAFAELGQIVLGTEPLEQILQRVVQVARRVLELQGDVSITLIADDKPWTIACTGDVAMRLDERQYGEERGPCLDAARAGQAIMVPDTATDERWPRFGRAASEHGVRTSLSIPLPVQRQVVGALNFYSLSEGAFDEPAIAMAQSFAAHAAVAVANTHLYESTAELAEQMQHAMQSRAVIEQAKGVIMRDQKCTPDEAFDFLVRLSQQSHRKLRDVAQALVDQVSGGG